MKRLILLVVSIILYSNLYAQGQIINVPTDQPTIQFAIDASVDGDTVLVADGTYFENINFSGKAITIASHFLIDEDETHIDSTIINGSQPSDPKNGTVVNFISGEDTTSVLYGLTITCGTGRFNNLADHYGGGGIAVGSSGGKILYNKIINNSINYSKAYGGGIVIEDPINNLIIKGNLIDNNVLNSSSGRGGGIFCIVYNPGDRIYIIENVITNNSSYTFDGGGGISINGGNPIVMNNLIKNNYGKYGGGVQYKNYMFDELGVDEIGMPKLNFVNNTVVNNKSDRYAGIHSFEGSIGNSTFDGLHPTILNSIIWGNKSSDNSQIHPDFIVEFSDIERGFVGHGNINLDPQFADTTNFYLSPSSPCVDAGIPYSTFNDVEVPNNPSSPLFPALGSLRNDMGAYGGNLKMFSKKMNGIIKVPTNLTTIQSAINVSLDGDTVLVADGRYYENINFNGKAITVASHFLKDRDETHIDKTIINGSKPTNSTLGAVVTFQSGEDTASVLCGFTITEGKGNIGLGHKAGGGIGAKDSGGKVIFNKIIYNKISYPASGGGGIVIYNPSSTFIISNNIIAHNEERSTTYTGGGGGIHIGEDRNGRVLIANNYIAHNKSSSASPLGRGAGGGIDLNQSCSIIRNNIIVFNESYQGGGLDIWDGNHLNGAIIENNTIAFNHATSEFGGGVIDGFDGDQNTIKNCIIWGNTAGDTLNQISKNLQANDIVVEYSSVQGGYEGEGNIDADPLFVDTLNFYLSALSPCIDAGNPDILFNDVEDENNTGYGLFPAFGELRNDIGAFGGTNSQWAEMTIIPDDPDSITSVNENFDKILEEYSLSQNYPNPFNPSTTIKYSIPIEVKSEKSKVKNVVLKVYDILGREVITLVIQKQKPGNYEVTWDASNQASGIYFYKLHAGDFVETKKMILLR